MASKRHTLAASMKLSTAQKKPTHPHARAAKIQLRKLVLDEIGADEAHVFDAFAGRGEMYRAVWNVAASYVACDQDWYSDERLAFVADNRRVLRSIDLAPFTVFDLDAFGSPWEQALIIAARRHVRPQERLGLVITEGSGLNLRFGGMPGALRQVAGLAGIPAAGKAGRAELLDQCISGLCRRMRCKLVRRWDARGFGGSSLVYLGLVVEGIAG